MYAVSPSPLTTANLSPEDSNLVMFVALLPRSTTSTSAAQYSPNNAIFSISCSNANFSIASNALANNFHLCPSRLSHSLRHLKAMATSAYSRVVHTKSPVQAKAAAPLHRMHWYQGIGATNVCTNLWKIVLNTQPWHRKPHPITSNDTNRF